MPGGPRRTLGQEPSCTCHWAMCSGGVKLQLTSRAGSAEPLPDSPSASYDGEVGSSLTCTLSTYVFGSFSNASTSLTVAYCFNHAPLYFLKQGNRWGLCINSEVPLKHPSSTLEWTYSPQCQQPPRMPLLQYLPRHHGNGGPGSPSTSSFL